MSTTDSVKSSSSAQLSHHDNEGEDENDDYFSKFNPFTGWQTLLLLQFQNQMTCVILVGLFISCIVCLTDCAYVIGEPPEDAKNVSEASKNTSRNSLETVSAIKYTVIYAFDLIYFIDVIFMLLYKRTKWSGSMRHQSRHGVTLTIELLSIIPVDLIYNVIVNQPSSLVFYCLRLRYTLRLVRLWTYFRDAKKYVGENSYVLHLAIYITYLFFKIIILGCVSYVYICVKYDRTCTQENYLRNIGISLYHVSAIFTLVGATGFLTKFVQINNIGFTLLSFIINNYFFAFFTCAIMQTLTVKFSHLNMYTWYTFRINQWKTDLQQDWKSYHRKYEILIKEFSNILWVKTKNQLPEQYLSQILPPIMYKEIYLDISWTPLKHTHLFRDEDVFFLRAVASIMKYEIYSPGQVIYKRNRYKDKMIYLTSGIVQILSEEDSETPIIILSAGTVLGESSLIVGCRSSSTTVSKGVCEVAVLHRKKFVKVISKMYPEKYKRLHDKIQDRYEEAKYYKKVLLYQYETGEINEKIGIISMQWLKLTLRRLLYSAQKLGYNLNKYYLEKLETHVFCVNYLDLLVQANDSQLVSDSVFIRNKFPLIFKPDSILQKTWEVFMLILAITLAWTYPIYFVYANSLTVMYWFFFGIVTLAWFLDLYIKSSTAVSTKYDSHVTVTNIILYRLTTVDYIADIAAALTPEVLFYMVDGNITINVARYACANRLCKVYKVHTFFTRIRGNTNIHVYFKYIQNSIYLCLLLYYCATILYIQAYRDANSQKGFEKFIKQFNSSAASKTLTLTCFAIIEFYGNLGYMNYPFLSNVEAFFALIIMQLLLYCLHLFLVSTIISFEILKNQSLRRMDEFHHNIDVTMRSYNISERLRERVWRYINLQREISDMYFLIAQNTFKCLPRDLYIMTCGIKIGHIIKNQPLFFEFSDYMLAHIGTAATLHLFPATEVMKYAGEVCTEIHILVAGYCTMKLQDGRSKVVEPGECLYILEAALNIPSLVTIIALTNCKIVTIKYQNLMSILLHYPVVYESLQQTVKSFPYWAALKKLQRHHHHVKKEQYERREAQPNVYCFGYRMKKRTRKFYQFHEGFPRGALFLKYILLRYTFHTNGKFVLYWEIVRCFLAFTVNVLFPMSCLSSHYEYNQLHLTIITLDVLALVDIYVRHHFTYFNEKGVEVMHPYKCARHYWKNAFLMDLFGCACFDMIIKATFDTPNRLPYYLNHTLQLYRILGLWKYLFRNNRNKKGLVLMLQFTIGTVIFINLLTGLTFSFVCEVTPNDDVLCLKGTWISKFKGNKYQTYSVAYFYVLSALAYSGFRTIRIKTMGEIYYFMFLLVFGFLMYNLMIAKVVATSLSINMDLMSYQQKMKLLVIFMNYKKIDKNLKHELVNHFEYMWYKTKGKNIHRAFEPFKTSFKVEALYNIYGSPLKDSNIFPPPNESFFRALLIDTRHDIYLKTGIIYNVNDISGDIYLILRG
ncbi:Cyclic nucleotide-binding domain [Popillia japonica]|uniref:Cyclic nucleotide-binding domain n=1 Tax=Popillia japonica TaxID=7064 RepID=A0AAW1K1X8_POPJA